MHVFNLNLNSLSFQLDIVILQLFKQKNKYPSGFCQARRTHKRGSGEIPTKKQHFFYHPASLWQRGRRVYWCREWGWSSSQIQSKGLSWDSGRSRHSMFSTEQQFHSSRALTMVGCMFVFTYFEVQMNCPRIVL